MNISFVQILNGKVKFVVVPNNAAELNLKNGEKFLVEKFASHRIFCTTQETAKIDRPLSLVGKGKMNLIVSQILCLRYSDGFHDTLLQIFFVIISGNRLMLIGVEQDNQAEVFIEFRHTFVLPYVQQSIQSVVEFAEPQSLDCECGTAPLTSAIADIAI